MGLKTWNGTRWSVKDRNFISIIQENKNLGRSFSLGCLAALGLPRAATGYQKPGCCWRDPIPAGTERYHTLWPAGQEIMLNISRTRAANDTLLKEEPCWASVRKGIHRRGEKRQVFAKEIYLSCPVLKNTAVIQNLIILLWSRTSIMMCFRFSQSLCTICLSAVFSGLVNILISRSPLSSPWKHSNHEEFLQQISHE